MIFKDEVPPHFTGKISRELAALLLAAIVFGLLALGAVFALWR